MVADNGLAVFSDEKALTTLAKDNRTLLEKIHDFFKQFIDKLKDIELKLSKSSAVYATINHDIDYLEQSAQKIRIMLDNVQNVNVQSKEKFSLDVNLTDTDFESNIKKVANMKSVADLDGTEFSKGDTDLVTQVTEYFNSIGNKVDSKFGTIKLTRTGVKSSVAHGIGRNKAIAFKAVPDVLKHGEIIDYTENYKNSKKDRAVIAAPITIANQDYNVATVIEINSIDNTFYLHELALQNKKDVLPFKTEPRHSNGLLSDNTSSIYTLLEKLQDVNTKYSKNTSGYIKNGSQCDRVVESLDKYLSKKYDDTFKLDGNKVEFISIEQSHGMGSYATFYIDFSINDTDGITIRYSGHTNSFADYYLWNDDFSSMKEIKEAIDNIIIHEITVEQPKRNELQSKYTKYSKNTLESEYMEAVDNGDEKEAEKALKNYAMQWGAYSLDGKVPLELYHGTTSFGFTEFDLNRMDDKRSIFLTDDIDTAQSYSGVLDVKKISEGKSVDYDKMSMKELANELSKYGNDTRYEYYTKDDIKQMFDEMNQTFRKLVEYSYPVYKNNLSSISKLYDLNEAIKNPDISNGFARMFIAWEYSNLYMHQNPAIRNLARKLDNWMFDLASDYYNSPSLQNEIEHENGGIAQISDTDLTMFISKDKAKEKLGKLSKSTVGNYKLYAKLNNPLVVDAEGRKWNDIRYKSPTEKYIVDEAQYSKGKFQVTNVSVNQPIWIDGTLYFDNAEEAKNALNSYLKSNNKDNKYYKYLNFTRDVAEYASNQGYDGVVFKNIVDYGGEGALSGVADNIIVAFDNKNVKSADTITYDDNGEVIPLSKRFSDKSDIRYSKDTSIDDFDVKKYNEVRISDKSEYAAVMSAIKMRDLNDTPHFEIRKIFAYDNIYLYYYDVNDNPHIVNAKAEESYRSNYYGIDTSTNGLFDDVKTRRSNSRYSEYGDEFFDGRKTTEPNDGLANRKVRTEDSYNGTGNTENDGDVDLRGEDNRKSRNTRLTLDDNIEDVNEAFLSAVKVLQNVHIDDIDLSSEVVTKAENAAKHIQNEVKKSGYRTQKLTGKGSVRSIATDLSEKYGNGKVTSIYLIVY